MNDYVANQYLIFVTIPSIDDRNTISAVHRSSTFGLQAALTVFEFKLHVGVDHLQYQYVEMRMPEVGNK